MLDVSHVCSPPSPTHIPKASRYDTRTTIFSNEGRLHQVEYAIKATDKAGPAVGIVTSGGIVLAAEKRVGTTLLDVRAATEKIFKIDTHIACALAGITSDANTLINTARQSSQQYLLTYQELAPIEHVIRSVCNLKQSYTQFGGLRPFGVSFLIAGWDKHHGFQLYLTDPSGNYSSWKAKSIGSSQAAAQGVLKKVYTEDTTPTLAEGLEMAVRVLAAALDTASPTTEKLEIATLTLLEPEPALLPGAEGGKRVSVERDVLYRVVPQSELKSVVDKVAKELEAEKAKEAVGEGGSA